MMFLRLTVVLLLPACFHCLVSNLFVQYASAPMDCSNYKCKNANGNAKKLYGSYCDVTYKDQNGNAVAEKAYFKKHVTDDRYDVVNEKGEKTDVTASIMIKHSFVKITYSEEGQEDFIVCGVTGHRIPSKSEKPALDKICKGSNDEAVNQNDCD